MSPTPTGIEAEVCRDIAERQAKGTAKYCTTVADNPLDLAAWLQHAYEECLDQAIYLKRAMAELKPKEEVKPLFCPGTSYPPGTVLDVPIPHIEARKDMDMAIWAALSKKGFNLQGWGPRGGGSWPAYLKPWGVTKMVTLTSHTLDETTLQIHF